MMTAFSMGRTVIRVVMTVALVLGVASTATAGTITFTGSTSHGSFGNQRVYTDGTVTMYATAWYWTGSTYAPGALGRYSNGLGACNPSEDGSSFPCENPAHTVDNVGQWDFVLFLFDAAVDLVSVRLEAYGDTDVSYRLGYLDGLDASSTSFPAILGWPWISDGGSTSDRTVTLNSPADHYNFLFLGGSTGSSDRDDKFKIKNLTFEYTEPLIPTPEVPEPGTIALLGLGLIGVAARLRRKPQVP